MLTDRLRDALETSGRFPHEQGGFRKGVGTEETLLLVTEEIHTGTHDRSVNYK